MRLMHGWLERIGYRSHLSGIYFNVLHSEAMLAGLRHRMAEIQKDDPAPVTLIGHSRGGLLAKVLSQRRPKSVEQVITLGSPLADFMDIALVTRAAGRHGDDRERAWLRPPPPSRGPFCTRPAARAGRADDVDLHAIRHRRELSQLPST
jgi:pimeloyl-ACP methyl ester carboxylesterase